MSHRLTSQDREILKSALRVHITFLQNLKGSIVIPEGFPHLQAEYERVLDKLNQHGT